MEEPLDEVSVPAEHVSDTPLPLFGISVQAGFSGERYFVFLRICAFALLISTLDIILKTPRLQENRGKIMAVIFLLLAVVLVRRYPVSFPSGSGYSADIERFEAVKPGEGVTIHFPPDWN